MEVIKNLTVSNKLGIHARAAARIVELVKKHRSTLILAKDGKEADGSNILSILTLACPKGTEIKARAAGEDCEELIVKLFELFDSKFGEVS
ncbi:MAG: HPr family phosphocarrier protein [Deltaproteobacteria bacterium CG_4_8_14_3_um_filter_51_11]|nr:HPr family phosphocarrier protein [bacterium]OIP43196.1 MAG: phosphocarrier protein HPr [Desulfobacteraceae bacterium CG2_30_51_40]PIP44741.1 MAG: phosphocarrier protein HPr [Deltaproteobacteria bacterium CG23_combo_of_CG06-09_8_20_14_all_51_20]PIX21108.1 MAG: HPr family phosphocarrier protein [Deltaproteobacteria bacterium CG_4_8_14_3_um_filter_51_11]PIY26155.1 MAG: HPr family phosphocarrier protein [Deltaproteobacteria bacterium CG_4_10_14_3_um_filter_51_14]PJB37121.1 MAG: HPr family phos